MYDKVSTNFEFVNREKKVLDFWNENHIFEKSIDSRKNAETFTFYDGHSFRLRHPGKVLQTILQLYGIGMRYQFVQYFRTGGNVGIFPVCLIYQSYCLCICFLRFSIACLLPVQVS